MNVRTLGRVPAM
ncbi:hypothetical protein E2C01_076753 [Portunus trituberculatus]|uniref:Uncharacterized protein n=1 Tax=Portunus trituberculatus TaxID=210409 RepID=A0A5B7IMU7_PORTR|nr:hypothetical protein [Portunus trituberculatus]